VPGALLALGTLVTDPDEFHENSPASWAAYIALATLAIAVLLALGVALGRVSRLARGGFRSGAGMPKNGR
jgi:hypothetical protein